MKEINKNFKTDICVSSLVQSNEAFERTKLTLVRCYFLLDKLERMKTGRNFSHKKVIKGFDCIYAFNSNVELDVTCGLCCNVLQVYPCTNSTLFHFWHKYSGQSGYPIAPKGIKKKDDNYMFCSDYYDASTNKYKGRNGRLRRSLLVYIIQQLEWAISHRDENFNPFDHIDKKHWTNTPKQLKRKVKRFGQVDK